MTPYIPLSHPLRQLPFTWSHCSLYLHFGQSFVHSKPYVLSAHSVKISFFLVCEVYIERVFNLLCEINIVIALFKKKVGIKYISTNSRHSCLLWIPQRNQDTLQWRCRSVFLDNSEDMVWNTSLHKNPDLNNLVKCVSVIFLCQLLCINVKYNLFAFIIQ